MPKKQRENKLLIAIFTFMCILYTVLYCMYRSNLVKPIQIQLTKLEKNVVKIDKTTKIDWFLNEYSMGKSNFIDSDKLILAI